MEPQATPQHKWLEQLVGEWTGEIEAVMGPGQPTLKMKHKDRARSLGGLWTIIEIEGEMPDGGVGHSIMTLGYDPAKERFVGTFIGSMMTTFWLYDGQLEGNTLTLNAEGPSFTDPNKLAAYQDIIEILSPDHRTLRSRVQGEDGNWTEFMVAHYHRVK